MDTNITPGAKIIVNGGDQKHLVIDRADAVDRAPWTSDAGPSAIFVELASNGFVSYVYPSEIAEVIPAKAEAFVSSLPTSANSWNSQLAALSVEHERALTFKYDKGNGVIETRTIDPTHVFESKRGGEVVVGYDPDRNDIRAYRLDRIQGYAEAS